MTTASNSARRLNGGQALADWGFDAAAAKRLTSLGLGFAEKK